MSRSINQFIIGTILTLLLISVAEAKNSEDSITPSTLAPGSLVNNQQKTDSRGIAVTTTNIPTSYTTPCPRGLLPDGNGGCYFEDTCEMIYGPCDCYGRSECCTYGECFIVCGPESNGSRNCRCSPPETIVPEPTTTAHNKCVKK
jgi:hypothetical protein